MGSVGAGGGGGAGADLEGFLLGLKKKNDKCDLSCVQVQ